LGVRVGVRVRVRVRFSYPYPYRYSLGVHTCADGDMREMWGLYYGCTMA
jgi:hypothetical protein